ncbi:MAG: hypothetical protein JNL87_02135 [Burkholderiaceae bacterium]|nr:hypothetical protein [Burkholderiaceae bacterium]
MRRLLPALPMMPIRYDRPWRVIAPVRVPADLLRVPAGGCRVPPQSLQGSSANGPPRRIERWRRSWAESRRWRP